MSSLSTKARLRLNFLLLALRTVHSLACVQWSPAKRGKVWLFFGSQYLLLLHLEHQHLGLHPWDVSLLSSDSGKSSALSVCQCLVFCGHNSIAFCQSEDSIKNCGLSNGHQLHLVG